MEDKRNTDIVVQEIMGLVHNAMSSYTLYKQADSEGWNNDDVEGRVVNDLALIKAKLRELAEHRSVREPLSVDDLRAEYLEDTSFEGECAAFRAGARYAERFHNITNTTKE